MNVFIDAGAHIGKAINKFKASAECFEGTTIHAFEANPNLPRKYGEGVILHRKAVWIEDGKIPFYFNRKKPTDDGASVIKNKITGHLDVSNPVIVECIDFSKWIANTFTEKDRIILKMDIEGAEYPVLRKMLKDKTITLIAKLYLESHSRKVHVSEEESAELLAEVSKHTVLEEDYIESTKIKEGKKRWHEYTK
jgi:FkbM family methyltransferase